MGPGDSIITSSCRLAVDRGLYSVDGWIFSAAQDGLIDVVDFFSSCLWLGVGRYFVP